MERLLNIYGLSAVWTVLVCALPLVAIGFWLRRDARRRAERVATVRAAERGLREVRGGSVTLTGTWRRSDGSRGFLEDDATKARVLIEREPDAKPLPDGARVLVVGCATHQIDDPCAAGYRADAKLWVVDTRGDGCFSTARPDELTRASAAARARGSLGAILFATGIAVALASGVVAWRAAHEVGVSYEDSAG
jgi:hypothetical protein